MTEKLVLDPNEEVVDADGFAEKVLSKLTPELRTLRQDMDAARGKDREEFATKVDAFAVDLEGLKKDIKRANARKIPGLEVVDLSKDKTVGDMKGKFSIWRHCQNQLRNYPQLRGYLSAEDCSFEAEVFQTLESQISRAGGKIEGKVELSQNVATDEAGGSLVANEISSSISPELQARMIAPAAKIQMLTGLVGNMSIVRDDGGETAAYFDSEGGGSITESQGKLPNVTISPQVMSALVRITHLALHQPAISMEAHVRGKIADKIARRRDKSIFVGTGDNGEPKGCLFSSSNTATSWTGAVFGGTGDTSLSLLRDMWEVLRLANVTNDGRDALSWIGETAALLQLEKAKGQDGRYLYSEVNTAGNELELTRLLSLRVLNSTQLVSTVGATDKTWALIKGTDVVEGLWGVVEIVAGLDGSDFSKGIVSIRGIAKHDVATVQPAGIQVATLFGT